MKPSSRRRTDNAHPYLFEGPHWELDPVRDLAVFLGHIGELLPSGSILCLAGGSWSKEGRRFLQAHAIPRSNVPPLPPEFRQASQIPIDEPRRTLLTELATRHAVPEMAVHIGGFAGQDALLEWYDVPSDQISVSMSVPQQCVATFAEHCRVQYHRRATGPRSPRR